MVVSRDLPEPTIERLVVLYRTVCTLIHEGILSASSGELGRACMSSAYNVRKDLSHLSSSCGTGNGYNLLGLKELLQQSLGFTGIVNACVVGLGNIGAAIMRNDEFLEEGYKIAAGFDSNVNRLELMRTHIPLFPAHEIPQRVQELHIEMAVVAVPSDAAQLTADRLVKGGIMGIVNFTHVVLSDIPKEVRVRNISVLKEFKILTALSDSITRAH